MGGVYGGGAVPVRACVYACVCGGVVVVGATFGGHILKFGGPHFGGAFWLLFCSVICH